MRWPPQRAVRVCACLDRIAGVGFWANADLKTETPDYELWPTLRDVPSWVVWIVGGAQRPQEQRHLNSLKKAAATLGIADRVMFLGQRPDLPRIPAAADIHCQPNTGPDSFATTFVEALWR